MAAPLPEAPPLRRRSRTAAAAPPPIEDAGRGSPWRTGMSPTAPRRPISRSCGHCTPDAPLHPAPLDPAATRPPPPAPAPVAAPAPDPLAPLNAVDIPAPAFDAANQADVRPASGAAGGMPHLASPEHLPPGSTMDPAANGTDSPNVSYLKDLWQAVQNHDISGKEALIMGLAQRSMNTPYPDADAGPERPGARARSTRPPRRLPAPRPPPTRRRRSAAACRLPPA